MRNRIFLTGLFVFLVQFCVAGTVYNRNQWYMGYGPNPKGVPGYETQNIPVFFVQPSATVMTSRAHYDPMAVEDHTAYPTPAPNQYVQTDRALEDYFDAVMNGAGPQAPSGYQTYDNRSPANLAVGGDPANKNLFPITSDFIKPAFPAGTPANMMFGHYTLKMTAGMIYRDKFDCGTSFEHPRYDDQGMETYNGSDIVVETNADWCFFLYIAPVKYPSGTVEGPMVGPVDPTDVDSIKYVKSGLAPWLPVNGDIENRIKASPDIEFLDGRYTVRSPYARILIPQNGLNLMANRYAAGRVYMQDRGRKITTKSKGSLAIVIGAIVGVLLSVVTFGMSLAMITAGAAVGGGIGFLLTPGPESSAAAGAGGGSKTATPDWANMGPLGPTWMFMEPVGTMPKKYAWGPGFPDADLEKLMLDAKEGWGPNADYKAGGAVNPPHGDIIALMPGMVTADRRYQFDQKSAYVPMFSTDVPMDGLKAVPADCSTPDMAPICSKYKPLMDDLDGYCSGACGPCGDGDAAALQAKMEGSESSLTAGSRSFPAGNCYVQLSTIYETYPGLINDWTTALANPSSKDVDLLRTPEGEAFGIQYTTVEAAVNAAGGTLAQRWFVDTDENTTFSDALTPVVESCKADFDAEPIGTPQSTKETNFHACVKAGAGPVMADYAAMEANPGVQTPFAFYTGATPVGQPLLGKLAWVEDYTGQPSPSIYNTYFDPADRCVPETPITSFIGCVVPKVKLGIMSSPTNLDKRWTDE